MSNHFKQNQAYGCGLYAIANIFQDESFLTEERLLESKNGNYTGQLNKWLIEEGKEYFLEPFYFDVLGDKLPDWVCNMKLSEEEGFSIPILIDVQFTRDSKTHFVAAELTFAGDLIVMDSCKDAPYITTLNQFNCEHHRVYGVWYLRPYSHEGRLIRSHSNKEQMF